MNFLYRGLGRRDEGVLETRGPVRTQSSFHPRPEVGQVKEACSLMGSEPRRQILHRSRHTDRDKRKFSNSFAPNTDWTPG